MKEVKGTGKGSGRFEKIVDMCRCSSSLSNLKKSAVNPLGRSRFESCCLSLSASDDLFFCFYHRIVGKLACNDEASKRKALDKPAVCELMEKFEHTKAVFVPKSSIHSM